MQHLMKCLVEDKYVYNHRLLVDSKIVKDIFWAYSNSIKLFNAFLTVFVMDSAYKTNKQRLLLLEFVGVT
jgi:hypothetical protein